MARRRSWRMVLFWILGTICVSFGAIIAGRIEQGIGTNYFGFLLALLISFVLFLLGGLLWISVAIAVKTVSEE